MHPNPRFPGISGRTISCGNSPTTVGSASHGSGHRGNCKSSPMPRYKDEPPAVRVYTVCDESRYLIVRNVPALGCGDELLKLFATCKPMDAEDCEPYTDVYWIKFRLVCNARFAKRKLDEFVFLGNRLQVSYAPQFESLAETKEKLESRRREVIARLNPGRSKASTTCETGALRVSSVDGSSSQQNFNQKRDLGGTQPIANASSSIVTRVSSDQDYFASQSMNHAVRLVREKLDKTICSSLKLRSELVVFVIMVDV
ncbi:hypothetical protein CDL15_Pgr011806 [Punica granatum]|uniref:RNA-binding protein 48 n=1 Tax=Punica granatum TaxID=22663 RepID=A0A218XDV2_PUNGR|nr:hypothetical protein CDL15_Pgr011806 [Punica granatum]